MSVELGQERYKWLPIGTIVLVLVSAGIWQPRMARNGRTLLQLVESPDLGYGSMAYLVLQTASGPGDLGPTATAPIISGDGWLNFAAKLRFSSAQLKQTGGHLRITGHQVAEAKGCSELHVKVVQNTIVVPTKMSEFTATVSAGELLKAAGAASEFEVGFDSPCAFVPGPQDLRRLFMYASTWDFTPGPIGVKTIRGDDARRLCRLDGVLIRCEVESQAGAEFHLPMLYYANFLSVTVNGNETPIKPAAKNEYLVSKVVLPGGKVTVIAEFVGSRMGNTTSLAVFIGWMIGIPLILWRFTKRAGALPIG